MPISIYNAYAGCAPRPPARPRSRPEAEAVSAREAGAVETEALEAEAAAVELSEAGKAQYKNTNGLLAELMREHESLRSGNVSISDAFLRDCLSDADKRRELTNMLRAADRAAQDVKEHKNGLQWVKIRIDGNGEMRMESGGGRVAFNAAKIARMLAAARTPEQVQVVLGILQSDLAECKAGAAKGMCDENEVAKVQAMIRKAMQKLGQVSGKGREAQEEGMDTFALSMLL